MNNNPGKSLASGFVLCLPVGALYYIVTGAPLMGCICGAFFFIAAASSLLQNSRGYATGPVVVAILIKFCLTMYQAKYKNLPMGGEDWWNYHTNAQAIIANVSNSIGFITSKADLFSKIVAILYSLFGVHTMYINLFVLASSFTAAKYVWKTALLVTENDISASRNALLCFLFWPINIIYSVTYLREMPIQMLCISSFFFFCKYEEIRRPVDFFAACILISMACMMHSGVIAFLLVYLILLFRKESETNMHIISLKNVFFLIMGLIIVRISPLWDSITAKFGISSISGLASRAEQFTSVVANTQYISDAPGNLVGFMLQMPVRAILFAVVPLPWMVYSMETAFAFVVDALPQFWILHRLWKLRKLTINTKQRIYYVACILGMIGTYLICGMGTTAYGNAIRHRAKIVPIVLVFVVAVYNHLKNTRVEKYG